MSDERHEADALSDAPPAQPEGASGDGKFRWFTFRGRIDRIRYLVGNLPLFLFAPLVPFLFFVLLAPLPFFNRSAEWS
ncbi:MAG: hypothetical protein LBI31_02660, partial [Zoogloeaceae bacterium]|nr:hypothetical protein [Zoogloeaceae bacterium]